MKTDQNIQANKKEINGYRLIFGYTGIFLAFIGLIILLPLIVIPFEVEANLPYLPHFIATGLGTTGIGLLLYFLLIFRQKLGKLQKYQDAVLILIIWLLSILISTIPLATSGLRDINFLSALYEMVSGFTTTGSSTLTPEMIEAMPKIFLLQRVITQLFGGIGLVLVITTAFSGKHGMKLYNAEGHSETFLPNLAKSARIITLMYLGCVVVGTGAFMIAGMNFFEAFSYSATCISTGGFSVTSGGIYGYNSLAIEIISMVLMVLGATNFFVHLFIIRGKFRKAYRDTETIIFLITVLVLPFICAFLLTPQVALAYFGEGRSVLLGDQISLHHYGDALRYTSFHIVSVITTTGLTNVADINALPQGFLVILSILFLIGGSSGSAAGGIKIYRMHLMVKGVFYGILDSFTSKKIVSTRFVKRYGEDQEMTRRDLMATTGFISVYIGIIVLGTFILSATNPSYHFGDTFLESLNMMSGVGLSIIPAKLNNGVSLWVRMILMILGRLEIFVVFNGIGKAGSDIVSGFKTIKKNRELKKEALSELQ